jgi:hypothetical protein
MQSSTSITCTVPALTLRAAPYSLPWGSSIYAKIVAINQYGNSLDSDEGNGAMIITKPDPPIDFIEDYSQRTKSTIGVSWNEAAFVGGTPVIDFRIMIAE